MSVITAKFDSTCPCCRSDIVAGSRVEWKRGSPARHVSCAHLAQDYEVRCPTHGCARYRCDEDHAIPAGVDPTYGRRPRGGCGNPRDCGDPTCHGECGY